MSIHLIIKALDIIKLQKTQKQVKGIKAVQKTLDEIKQLIAQKEYDQAISLIEEVEQYKVMLGDLYYQKSKIFGVQGNMTEMKRLLELSIKEDKNNITVAKELSNIYVKDKEYHKAIKTLKLCFMNEDKSDAKIHNLIGEAYLGLEDSKNAIRAFNKAIKLDSFSSYSKTYKLNLAKAEQFSF